MKFYYGRRSQHGCAVDVEEDGEVCLLNPRPDLQNNSITDMEWGNVTGGGQAQLALAADVLRDDKRALQVYQRLSQTLIGRLPHEGWAISERQVRAAIEAVEREKPRAMILGIPGIRI